MRIEKRTMNWLPRASAYDEAVAQRARRKALNEDFITRQTALADTFSGAQIDAVTEMGNIVSQAAQARMSQAAADEARAQQEQLGSLLDATA
jgi:hypothetical protein